MAHVAIALGSNVGDRERMLREGVAALQPHLRDVRVSTFHDTDPVGVGPQPTFLNAAAVGVTVLPPRDLLQTLLDIERTLGRERPYPGAPRTLDLIIDGPGLVIPHPRFRDRAFVLRPLAEIAPEWTDPVTGRTVQDLLDSLKASHPRAT